MSETQGWPGDSEPAADPVRPVHWQQDTAPWLVKQARISSDLLPVGLAIGATMAAGLALFGIVPPAGYVVAAAALAGTVALAWSPGVNRHLQREPTALRDGSPTPSHANRMRSATRLHELDTVLDALPNPIVIIDHTGQVVRFNPAAKREFRALTIGRHFTSALRMPSLLHCVETVLDGSPLQQTEFSVRVPIERHFGAIVAPIDTDDADGRANQGADRPVPADGARAFIHLTDLSAAKRIEQLRADFVTNASHELRTPLMLVSAAVETLQTAAKDDADARESFLADMATHAARMGRLINDLLSLSKIELNEHVAPETRIDFAQVARDMANAMRPVANAAAIEIAVDLGDESLMVLGDNDQLAQVFQNLIDNAIRYGRPDSQIDIFRLDTPPTPDLVGIAVRDHGRGIPRRHLPRLTERFYRVDAAESRERGGTGLGLAIVKHILNRHRGSLTIDSKEGEGSTFGVWVPRIPAAEGDGPKSAKTPKTNE